MLKRLSLVLAFAATTAAAQTMTCVPTGDDADRLAHIDEAWKTARAEAIAAGHGDELRRLGPVADPRAGLGQPQPTPGRYQCRTIKLGAANPDLLPYIAYGWFRCEVSLSAGGDLMLRKTTGSQRQVGLICPVDTGKARFVGVLALGDEVRTPRYGSDPERNLVGIVQRTGDDTWRIAFPWPVYESKLDILELRRVR